MVVVKPLNDTCDLPQVQIAACYVKVLGEILLLKRASHKVGGDTWGVPAGRLEKFETPIEAAKRELFEETGIMISDINKFVFVSSYSVKKPQEDIFGYHGFSLELDTKPTVLLSDEHTEFCWMATSKLTSLPLISGSNETLLQDI